LDEDDSVDIMYVACCKCKDNDEHHPPVPVHKHAVVFACPKCGTKNLATSRLLVQAAAGSGGGGGAQTTTCRGLGVSQMRYQNLQKQQGRPQQGGRKKKEDESGKRPSF
jgi:predicted RNA-binding Zn-ribbon protein involved in translation (DUF1610 family)